MGVKTKSKYFSLYQNIKKGLRNPICRKIFLDNLEECLKNGSNKLVCLEEEINSYKEENGETYYKFNMQYVINECSAPILIFSTYSKQERMFPFTDYKIVDNMWMATFNEQLLTMARDIKESCTEEVFENLKKLNMPYAAKLYLYMVKNDYKDNKELIISEEDCRSIFDIEDDRYVNNYELVRKVLKSVLADIKCTIGIEAEASKIYGTGKISIVIR